MLLDKLQKLKFIDRSVANTQMVKLNLDHINVFAKLEFQLFSASTKIRPAYRILTKALQSGDINENSIVIESSSGNFAIAMSMLCDIIGLKFVAVVDPNTNSNAIKFLDFHAHKIIKVTERDQTGGFLLNRLNVVKKFIEKNSNAYWTNQYGNIENMNAHYYGTAGELIQDVPIIDYAFIGAGTCGSLSGISTRLKEKHPNIKIIAVDIEGSLIFDQKPKSRYIPGMGSSIKPNLLKYAKYDELIIVDELNVIGGCHELLFDHFIFGGGSSGTVYYAIKKYFENYKKTYKPNIVFLCPDGGRFYLDTVYNKKWVKNFKKNRR